MPFAPTLPDLMPPAFAEGLDDWSRGDGTPDCPTYDGSGIARLAQDAEFGICLELRTEDPVQRLRYMGELPVPPGAFLEISARLKVLRGPLPEVRIAAWPGGAAWQADRWRPGCRRGRCRSRRTARSSTRSRGDRAETLCRRRPGLGCPCALRPCRPRPARRARGGRAHREPGGARGPRNCAGRPLPGFDPARVRR